MENSTPKLPISLEALKEMEKIALVDPVPGISKLEYPNAQQVLAINALIKYLGTFGIDVPFELKI